MIDASYNSVNFNVQIKFDFEAIAQLRPDQLEALMVGIAKVLATIRRINETHTARVGG